jgi:hypothetical protein
MDDDTLTFLLRGGHIGLADRVARGLWPHPPLRFRELARHVARVVRREGSFPRPWRPHEPGQPVDEHGVVERRGPFRYVYRAQRHHATDPRLLAEVTERTFLSAVAAARHYLRWDLHLPGDLDGWVVE